MLRTLPLAAAALMLAACSASPSALEDAVDDRSGVVRVRAVEVSGDDGLPFMPIAKAVTVRMEADASEDEVMAVFDAYDEAIEDGDVVSVAVTLEGPKKAALSAGEGILVSQRVVDDLVDAQRDDAIAEYRREAHPVLPSVEIALARGGLDEVVTVADRYRDAADVDLVTVSSGDFLLIRDEVNEDLQVTAAREQVVRRVGAQFRLRGATVAGRGPLEIVVEPTDVEAVRRLLQRLDLGAARSVVVTGR